MEARPYIQADLSRINAAVATEPAFRRLGLARAVMTEGLHRMAAAGMHTAQVEHEIANEPAATLYASLGFIVAHATVGLRRKPQRSYR